MNRQVREAYLKMMIVAFIDACMKHVPGLRQEYKKSLKDSQALLASEPPSHLTVSDLAAVLQLLDEAYQELDSPGP